MANIQKRVSKTGEVTYQIVFELGTDPVTGKRQRIYKTVRGNKKQAQAIMDKMKLELERGYCSEPSNMKLGDWMTQWLDNYMPNIETTTRILYRDNIRVHITPELGHVLLKHLKTTSIQAWVNDLHAKKNLSANTVQLVFMLLRVSLEKAVILRMLTYNPCKGVVLPKTTKYKANIYTAKEINQLLDLAKDTKLYIPILLATNLGLRRGEIFALRWEHVDFASGIIHIRESMVTTTDGIMTKAPKSAAGIRDITAGAQVMAELKKAHKKYMLNKLAMGRAFKDSGLVHSKDDGSAYSPRSLASEWHRFLDKNGLRPIRFHDLRHSCATAMLEAGVDPKTVQTRLGHSHISITMNTYAHCTTNMDRNAAQKLEDLFTNAV